MLKRALLLPKAWIFIGFLLLLIWSPGDSKSQTSRWENYTDFKNVVAASNDPDNRLVYAASKGGLFVLNQANGEIVKKFTNLNGLLNIDLTALTIDSQKRLWVGASDGSIAIYNISTDSWQYIYDIKNSTEANKSINFFKQFGNFIFVATGYGIHKISVSDFQFADAPYVKLGEIAVNTPVNALTVNNNILFAATKGGVAYANILTSNLNDPASWASYRLSPINVDVQTIESFNNYVFAGSASGFMYFNGVTWSLYPNGSVSSANTKYIKAIANNLYFISNNVIYFAEGSNLADLTQVNTPSSYTTLASDNDMNLIAGTSDNGVLVKVGSQFIFDYPNGPYTNSFDHLAIDDNGNIWAAGGTGAAGFYMFNGESWENYNTQSYPQLTSNWYRKIAAGNGEVWALSYGGGPVLLINGQINTIFSPSNSNLPGIGGDPNFCAVYGGAFDNNGIFWTTFFATNSNMSLYAYTGSFTWTGIPNPSLLGSAPLSEIATDSYNTKWIVSPGGGRAVYFFNENGNLSNPGNYVYGVYNTDDLGSEVSNAIDIIIDKNNEVWIATNNGVFIIRNPLAAIQNPSQKPRPEKLGIISGGLRVPFTENCTSITNDILNDKWIGTETNGVFHLSSDGNTLIKQFNTVNSPILSNKIMDIKVSNVSGRAYFATLSGLSSYSTDAIEPVADFDKIISSPNPFLVPSGSLLKIDGLVENSIVKIIKLNGEVITEFTSPGGRIATWNGMSDKNELVASGIYIIVAYNKDGSKVGTGKVAIVRK